ncbi:hypothetical protein CC80DRAFT_358194, partial [Byssothecium circinans]
FSVSIFFMEIVTIGFPIAQVFKSNALRQETLEAIASWEKRKQLDESSDYSTTRLECSHKSSATVPKASNTEEISPAGKTSFDSQKSEMLTMAALDNALQTDPVSLLQFAALKDFSGENVGFLTHLADWPSEWVLLNPSTDHRRKQFVTAACIYAQFVSLENSEFPINISSKEGKALHNIFEDAATQLLRRGSVTCSTDSATPFDTEPADSDSMVNLHPGVNLDTLGRANLRSVSRIVELRPEEALATVTIPEAFTDGVFDAAERETKYLVLTNTWPKFVN